MENNPPLMIEQHKQIMNEWYEQYFSFLFRYAKTNLGQDQDAAALCAHAVFDTALNDIESLKLHDNIGGWMMKTLQNQINNYRRTKKMQLEKDYIFRSRNDRYVWTFELWADDMIKSEEIAYMKGQIIARLSPNDRELYHLYYKENKTINEVSTILKTSEGAAKMRISRLRNRICDFVNNIF